MAPFDQVGTLLDDAGIYRVAGLSAAQAMEAARAWNWRTAHLNATTVDSKASFLRAAAGAMAFPAYFGHNWDAFEECLRDLPLGASALDAAATGAADGYLLFIDEPALFARSRPRDWATALSILAEVVNFWRAQGVPFYVLLHRTRGAAPRIPLLP